MANEINIQLEAGLTVIAQLVQAAAQVGSNISLTESGTLSGFYSGNMPSVTAGLYFVRFVSGGSAVGSGQIVWDGSAEVTINDLSQFDASTDTVSVSAIATDAIDSDAIASSAITEIQAGLATAAAVGAIPINPLLTNDARLNNLDAAISSRSSHGAPDLGNLDVAVSTRLASAGYTAPDNAGITTLTTRLSATRAVYLDKLDVTGDLAHSDAAATYRATGFSTLNAAGVRAAVGMSTANLDTQLADIPTVAELNGRTLASADYALEATLGEMQGATFDGATDSLEAIRDRGDAAWMTGSGGGSGGGDSAATIYSYFTSSSRQDVFKADVSNLDVAVSSRLAEIDYTDPLDATATQAAAAAALTAYDLPNHTDVTTGQAAILNAIANLPSPSDATLANQTAILSALTGLDDLAKANEVITPTSYRKVRVGTSTNLVNKAVTNDGNGNITLTEVA